MNLLQIALTTKCNLKCSTCPMKEWRNVEPKFPLTNRELIPFIERYCTPDKWVIELTGGEPALYDGLDELCTWLSKSGYKVLIKTNGLLEIEAYPNIRRCAAFHQFINPPKYYDIYLIIDKLDSERKIAYCRYNRIPFRVIGLNKTPLPDQFHRFDNIAFINAAGHQVKCPSARPITNEVNGVDINRITHKPLDMGHCCDLCKIALDAWRFYDGMA